MNRRTTRWMRTATALTTAALASLLTSAVQAQDTLWIRQLGTSEWDSTYSLAPDGAGGVFVAGHTAGSLGGPNAGGYDAFLARYDTWGSQLWIRQFGTSLDDGAGPLWLDGAGGVIVWGSTEGSLGGPNAGGRDVFVARYDNSGNRIWIRQFGTSEDDGGGAVPDGAGGVFVGGSTEGSPGGPNAGDRDVFLARYDSAGTQLWIRQFGTINTDMLSALTSDGVGGLFVAGMIDGMLRGVAPQVADAFLARYNSDGDQLWIRRFGTGDWDWAFALAPDTEGGVMVAGFTQGNVGGPNGPNSDGFLARYDRQGNRLWFRQFGTHAGDWASVLTPDGAGGVVVAGQTDWSFGGPHAGYFDVFLAGYDGAGNQLWLGQFGSSDDDYAMGLASDGAGGVMVAGRTGGSLGGPFAGGWNDAFIARFGDFGCYHADCDQSTGAGVLDMLDFLCFQRAFMNGEEFACDCDKTTGPATCDIFDFLCFQNAFVAGCP